MNNNSFGVIGQDILVSRLRIKSHGLCGYSQVLLEAAEKIEQLTAEIARLQNALDSTVNGYYRAQGVEYNERISDQSARK